MNVANLIHPTKNELAAFSAGRLDAIQSDQIEQHLAECESCCQVLKMLPDDDTLVSLLRDPEAETSVSPDQPDVSAKNAQTIPPTSEQPTIPPAHSRTELIEETDLVLTQGLPAELSEHPRYDVLELLGKGGMGDVYKAHHRMMNRPVALKLINGQLVQSDAAVKRFHREVQAAARLSHPNIVTAYDAEQAGDVHYLVMEFVDGMNLAEVVSQRGPLPVAEACEFIRQAAEGLQHAHELGMVHRDIKPQNLMVQSSPHAPREEARHAERDGYDVVKILDFGLANFATESAAEQDNESVEQHDTPRVPTHLTMMGSMMGTPDYISPEQARDAHSADIRSDIYSLGCTLHCLLTGEPPFASRSTLDKVMAHVESEPKPLSDFRDDVPAGVDGVLRRMMAKNPDDRFQTPAEVAQALSPFTISESAVPAKQASSSRWPIVPLTIAAILMLGLIVAFGAVIVVATARGRVVIQSEVDDVSVAVIEGGKQIDIIDLKTGSQVHWLPIGNYELKLVGNDNDVTIDNKSFQMTRLGKVIVTAKWNSEGRSAIRSFKSSDPTITRDNIVVADGGWKITAAGTRTVRLFEVPMPKMKPGPYFYRAKMKSENVKGRAYLEMWSRFPGQGEFFSKGFDKAISGTNGWAEYEIPFFLKKGQQPDLVKLNLTIEGGGTVWIKDVELRGRSLTPSPSGVIRTGAPPKTGILTSPPAVPPGGLPIGRNLITDPSLENTADGALPRGWSAWLNDGPDFNCEVVEGGVTGNHCLRISGTGTRGVVFATSIPLDRTKRYALKGQVKVEGEIGTWAVIKLNYFNKSGWLGVDDRVGVTTSDGKWKFFEKTDMADRYPDATLLVPTCHIEGNGTACFDDLELIAYDRDKLPTDFDEEHGKNNRK